MKNKLLVVAALAALVLGTGTAQAATVTVKAKEGTKVTLQALGKCKAVGGNQICKPAKTLGTKVVKGGKAVFTFAGNYTQYCVHAGARGACGKGGTIVVR